MAHHSRSEDISSPRRAADAWLLPRFERAAAALVRHWLLAVNLLNGALFVGAFVAPMLLAMGASLPARALYFSYSFVCHQLPYRAYFIFGYQVAQCQRNTAIFASLLAGGIAFALLRRRVRSLDWRLFGLLILPMAIDGTTQLFGWRESNWELRTITGALFGLATVWFVYPYVDRQLSAASRPRAPKPHRVVLYAKPDCPLCDKAKVILERLREGYALSVEEIDITTDAELRLRFGELIPVIYIDGHVAAVSKVSEVWLRRKLDESAC